MNNKIRKQDLEKLLVFDIETVRRNKELDINSKEYDLYAWKLRDKETSKLPPSNEVLEHYKLNGALDPVFNRIVCISVGFIKDKTIYLKSFTGEQKTIIEDFYNLLNSTGFIPTGFNVINFDSPTIRLKALESGVDLSLIGERYNDVGQKPWTLEDAFVDLMPLTKGTYYHNLSLDAMCFLAGVDTPKDGISGADVSRVFWEEDGLDRISTYCKKDVKAVADLLCVLQGKRGYIENVVDRDLEVSAQPLVEKQPLLKRIFAQKDLTEENKKELLNLLKAKKLLKKDKEKVLTLISASLAEINQDFGKITNQSQIDEIINQLREEI